MSSITLESPSLPPLNPLLLEDPQENANQLQSKAFTYNLISKICALAFLAIIGVVLAISYELLVLPGWATFLLLSSILSTPLLFTGITKYHELSMECKKRLEIENSVIEKFKELQENPSKIKRFYKKHAFLQLPKVEENSSLLPQIYQMIARISACEKKFFDALDCVKANFREDLNIAWKILEFEAIPLSLNLAVKYKILENPFFPYRNIFDIGELVPRDFSERWQKVVSTNQDDYFIANKGSNLPTLPFFKRIIEKEEIAFPLKFEEIKRTFFPQTLYHKLFSSIEALNESRSRSNA